MARSLFKKTSLISAVSVATAKQHLRVANTQEDTYIESLIFAATAQAEAYCNINIMQAECVQTCDCWEETYELYHSPIQNTKALDSVVITYYDENNALQTWANTNYDVDASSTPARIFAAQGISYPQHAERIGAIQVSYKSGLLQSKQIPKDIQQAILILVGQWYENRQEAIVGRSVGVIPMTARYILDKYRIRTFGIS